MSDFGYKEMLGIYRPYTPTSDKDLDALALSMTGTKNFHAKSESFFNSLFRSIKRTTAKFFLEIFGGPETAKDPEDSEIPAGYTYLAQFIAHDLSEDSKTKQEVPAHRPFDPNLDITDITNLKSPLFDLETIYGKIVEGKLPEAKYLESDNASLKLGWTSDDDQDKNVYPNDFNREVNGTPNITDLRNDENLLLAQMQIAFMKFHNAIVLELKDSPNPPPDIFKEARRKAIRHYQYIVLNDFLPTIVQDKILKRVIKSFEDNNHQNIFYNTDSGDTDFLYLPLEFTVGAFRFGHSMVRSSYNLNEITLSKDARLDFLIRFIKKSEVSLKNRLRSSWVINWNLFFDIPGSQNKPTGFNLARKINTKYEGILGTFSEFPGNEKRINSLSAIDLYRAVRWKLPTGQAMADNIINKLKARNLELLRNLTPVEMRQTFRNDLTDDQKNRLTDDTPFLYYILAEAEVHKTGEKLGDIGSWIVSEVFIKLLYESPYSILQDKLEDSAEFLGNKFNGKFGIAEMLLYSKEILKKDFGKDVVIDPVGQSLSN